ncbi:CsbD family protein [Nocardia sp. NPDC048505]|uniref:CsbD family protein n=1 Tax=unclassified Nocardia TaxID=2637762 RepID=UPI0033D9A221
MSTADKAQNKADELAGKAKEKFGEATDDQDLKNEGKGDQVKSNLKDAGEKVKDAFRD